jgi:hypothetical protein
MRLADCVLGRRLLRSRCTWYIGCFVYLSVRSILVYYVIIDGRTYVPTPLIAICSVSTATLIAPCRFVHWRQQLCSWGLSDRSLSVISGIAQSATPNNERHEVHSHISRQLRCITDELTLTLHTCDFARSTESAEDLMVPCVGLYYREARGQPMTVIRIAAEIYFTSLDYIVVPYVARLYYSRVGHERDWWCQDFYPASRHHHFLPALLARLRTTPRLHPTSTAKACAPTATSTP